MGRIEELFELEIADKKTKHLVMVQALTLRINVLEDENSRAENTKKTYEATIKALEDELAQMINSPSDEISALEGEISQVLGAHSYLPILSFWPLERKFDEHPPLIT